MSKPENFPIDKIYVPVKRKKALKPELVHEIAESILEIGQQAPIFVRPDESRFVLVDGLHRLEACKALGETTILGVLVSAETAHAKALLADSVEVEAERDKMARLRRLRLEKQAAWTRTATAKIGEETGSRLRKPIGTNLKTSSSQSGRTSEATPRTLSQWLTEQKRDGGRY
jgi:ParB-like chromosome segregation protein Spo0J